MEHDGTRTSYQCEHVRAPRESDRKSTFFFLPQMCCGPSGDLDSD